MPTASSPPRDFVQELIDPGFFVLPYQKHASLRQYLCAAGMHGGNTRAAVLQGALRAVTRGTQHAATIKNMGIEYDRVFMGQGKPECIDEVMWLTAFYDEKLKTYKHNGQIYFAKYYAQKNPIQAMVDDKMFGLDCIGFVGRYLEWSGILASYPPYYPRNYCDKFLPITDIKEIDDLCVLVWVNGHHVAMLDTVVELRADKNPPYAIVSICQSSSGGPQTNSRVRLQKTSGDFLDFGAYGKVVNRSPHMSEDDKKDLRKQYTKVGAERGYRGGIFLDVQLGDPKPPVVGRVYACKLPGGITKGWRSIELD